MKLHLRVIRYNSSGRNLNERFVRIERRLTDGVFVCIRNTEKSYESSSVIGIAEWHRFTDRVKYTLLNTRSMPRAN